MTINRWPDTLPTPSTPGFGLSPVDQSVRTNMEVGAQRVRRRTNARFDRMTMEWVFSPTQMDAFRTWHEGLPYSLLGSSDVLSGWSFVNVTRSIGGAISPDGFVVDRAFETAVTGVHRVDRAMSAFVDNSDVFFCASVKGVSRTRGRLTIVNRAGVALFTEFNVSDGTMSTQSGLISRSIQNRGNGWWRVIVIANVGAGASNPILRIQGADDSGTLSYAGDVTRGFDICEVATRFSTGSDLFMPTETTGAAAGAYGGSAWFYLPVVVGSTMVSREARFIGPYKAVAKAGLNWSVTAEVEVRNA